MAKSNKGRKINRNRIKCSKYAAEHRRVKNSPIRKDRNGKIISTPRKQRDRERSRH